MTQTHDYRTILVEVADGVATLTLNRPDKRNAIDLEMNEELFGALWALEADETVRVIVVTGAGPAFCAGADLSAGAGTFGADAHERHDAALGVDSDTIAEKCAFWRMATPILGAINGAAVGAGLTLALLFDVRYAAEDAKLSFPFTRVGMIPEANSTWLVPRLVGLSRGLELLLSGRIFTGAEAAEMGLVSRALPRERVLDAVLELARDIARNTAPASVALTKRLVHEGLEQTDRLAAMRRETKLTWWTGEQPDAAEGVMAFLEKREPRWKGSKHLKIPPELEGRSKDPRKR